MFPKYCYLQTFIEDQLMTKPRRQNEQIRGKLYFQRHLVFKLATSPGVNQNLCNVEFS